ncbi:MAG: DUF6364 family protein [Bacteroidota bacterium]
MNTKLTLTLEEEVIKRAKQYASQKGRSLSELVENYFRAITQDSEAAEGVEISDKTKKLKGILKVSEDFDYRSIVEEEAIKKYNG